MNIVNVGYDSTNYYIIAKRTPLLLVDVGWPGSLPKLADRCKRTDTQLQDIKYLLITHYHPDHAGLAQEVKRTGTKLIVFATQIMAIPLLRSYMKPHHNYVDIDLTDNITLSLDDSRAFLSQIGIQGEIIGTPGHSDDSVSLILDEGVAFTGDLTPPFGGIEDAVGTIHQSWEKIRSFRVKTIYPGHGPMWKLV
jgi:glyoxylase-like metal-dependent hydrolase (beta-lactamase superfamily II)